MLSFASFRILVYAYFHRGFGVSDVDRIVGKKFAQGCINQLYNKSRSPHGERGLKSFPRRRIRSRCDLPLPARGAWIEIMMEGYSIYRMLSDRAKDLKAKADAK